MQARTELRIATGGLAALYLAGAAALGTPPDAADDGPAIVAWFRDNGGHVRAWLWLSVLTIPLFALFVAQVRRQLPVPHRDVFLFGAVALAIEGAAQGWIWAGLAWHPERLDPATARTLFDIASFWGPVLTSTTVTLLAPITLLAWRRQAGLPRWLAWITGVAVVEQLVETVTIFGDRGFTAPGGPMNLVLGAGLVLVALVSTGIATARTMPA